MNMLFYRYGSICEPDIISTFSSFGLTVIEEKTEIYNKHISNSSRVELVRKLLESHKPVFVFTINFFSAIAELCHIYGIPYLSWSVDCPVMDYFDKAMLYRTNRIFLFDYEQYKLFHPYNPDCVFYLPLASSITRFDSVIKTISAKERLAYSSDISFVGSLYSEKNHYKKIAKLSDYAKGYIDGIADSALKIYGYNVIEDSITDTLVEEFIQAEALPSHFSSNHVIFDANKYAIAHQYIGYHVAELERIKTLNTLAKEFKVDLYTASDSTPLHCVTVHPPIKSMYEMPKVFHCSKINLNMTIKPIKSGLPLRIFDIMGCGGFLMTNYQSELADYFDIGTDIECYSSLEELIDKCAYYLTHDEIRNEIALHGYQKVKTHHTLEHRISEMIKFTIQNM